MGRRQTYRPNTAIFGRNYHTSDIRASVEHSYQRRHNCTFRSIISRLSNKLELVSFQQCLLVQHGSERVSVTYSIFGRMKRILSIKPRP